MPSSYTTKYSTFRVFSSPKAWNGAPVGLGRDHASWFLVFARPHSIRMTRAALCLNFIVPDDPSTVSGVLPAKGKKLRFTIGGTMGPDTLQQLLDVHDELGRSPVEVVRRYPEGARPYELCAIVEVRVPEDKLVRACARCGRWEAQLGPRFLRCSGCRGRYYCSKECQKDDWKPVLHKGECALLRKGKAFEAETARGLHNNGWYFDNGVTGTKTLLEGSGQEELDRAMDECDCDYLAYGQRSPPHDAPLSSRPYAAAQRRASAFRNLPPGFVRTGDSATDDYLIKLWRMKKAGTSPSLLAELSAGFAGPLSGEWKDKFTLDEIPAIPPLPATPGFTATGDPLLDEVRLFKYLTKKGTTAQQKELKDVVRAREEAVLARQRLAARHLREVLTRSNTAMAVPYSSVSRLNAMRTNENDRVPKESGYDSDDSMPSLPDDDEPAIWGDAAKMTPRHIAPLPRKANDSRKEHDNDGYDSEESMMSLPTEPDSSDDEDGL